jgi:hypothetical protein
MRDGEIDEGDEDWDLFPPEKYKEHMERLEHEKEEEERKLVRRRSCPTVEQPEGCAWLRRDEKDEYGDDEDW